MKSYIVYVYNYNFLNYEMKSYKEGQSFHMEAKKVRDVYDRLIHGKKLLGSHKS